MYVWIVFDVSNYTHGVFSTQSAAENYAIRRGFSPVYDVRELLLDEVVMP